MHDTLEYMKKEPVHRKWHHHLMTFGIHYAWSENFVLPLSHDEVVHGKGSLLGKMPGDRWQQFANLSAYFGFMWAHPGQEAFVHGWRIRAGARVESRPCRSIGICSSDTAHAGMQRLVRDLNALYRDIPALHALDCDPAGFAWIEGGDTETEHLFVRTPRTGRLTRS